MSEIELNPKLELKPKLEFLDIFKKKYCEACYLIINWRLKDLIQQAEIRPTAEFYKITADYVYDYVVRDRMPPEDIAPVILNLGEDFMANRDVNLRAGDYIVLQNHIRRLKTK